MVRKLRSEQNPTLPAGSRRTSRQAAGGPLDGSLPARQRGFSLIELIVVITIIGILAGVAIANVKWAQQKAREAALRHDLFEMRKAIDDFYADKQHYPGSLSELAPQYLRRVPKDPITQADDWEEVSAEATDETNPAGGTTPAGPAGDLTAGPGIVDVRSSAPGNALDGTPYHDL
jgi:general secretion pathway protein G